MSSESTFSKMKVSFGFPSSRTPTETLRKTDISSTESYVDGKATKVVRVEYGGNHSYMEISFQRTVRIPDDGGVHDMPPDCGRFPLYPVKEHKSRLPLEIVKRKGCFLPIYDEEALWINFVATRPFAVKIYTGDVNAISGETTENERNGEAVLNRRKSALKNGRSLQDYVVAGSQKWLDGVYNHDGEVSQFVATPKGSGYSVNSQVKGYEGFAGLQFEIVPHETKLIRVKVEGYGLEHASYELDVYSKLGNFIAKIGKELLPDAYAKSGPRCCRCLFDGSRVAHDDTPYTLHMEDGDCISFLEELLGGGPGGDDNNEQAMTIAPAALIRQSIISDPIEPARWETNKAVLLSVHLINASIFEELTGLKPPPEPISGEEYAKDKCPLFSSDESPRVAKGDFKGMESVGQGEEDQLDFHVVTLPHFKPSFVPVGVPETVRVARLSRDVSVRLF